MIYRFPAPLVPGAFIKRENRFSALVQVGKDIYTCHVPNSGRMKELLKPGTPVMLNASKDAYNNGNRKTPFDLFLVYHYGVWVSVDSRLPNLLLLEMVKRDLFVRDSPAAGSHLLNREPSYGKGRFDALLDSSQGEKLLVECKSVTLVDNQKALFPDAPTLRGKRHLEELVRAVREGYRAIVAFLVQREDARCFGPNWAMDPEFSKALVFAVSQGVAVESYAFGVKAEGISTPSHLPVQLKDRFSTAKED